MAKLQAHYRVILRSGLPEKERELLTLVCKTLPEVAGESLLYFDCTVIDSSHHFYLGMETIQTDEKGEESVYPLRIPSQYIFLMSGSSAEVPKKGMGFMWPERN